MPAKELLIKKVSYKISPSGVKCDMDLGEISLPFGKEIVEQVKKLEDEKELAQANLKQLEEGIQVAIGSFQCPGATGNYSVTGIPFKPRYVEFMAGSGGASAIANSQGWMDYNGNMGSSCWAAYQVGPACYSGHTTNYCIYLISSAGAVYISGIYVSMNADGFTVNFTAVNAGFTIIWKAVR